MGLIVHFRGGTLAGKSVEFDDSQERIVLGRDPQQCQVVFPADDTRVGREHLALVRELGRYRLRLNHDNRVFIDGKPAIDGQELRAREENVQIGQGGPTLMIETVHDKGLVSTDEQGRQHGPLTLLDDASRKASAGRRVASMATLLVLVAAGVGFWAWRLLNEDVQNTVASVGKLTQASREQTESLKNVTNEVGDFKDKIRELDKVASLEKVVRKASPSVYLVLAVSSSGVEDPQATAWVVDKRRGILATNAHVGRIPDEFGSGFSLIVRSSTNPVRTHAVKKVDIHPGYDQFDRLWRGYDPARPVGVSSTRSIRSVPACDVALLTVDKPDELADALPLAPLELLGKLEPGDPVALVGFPLEGLVLGGVNTKSPTPTRHMAYLTAVTSYFGDAHVPTREQLLVQHALPTVGGASGSPVLNSDGQVVAIHSAGNSIGSVETSNVRIVSAARISYAQRADLIQEMLDGSVDRLQGPRRQGWDAAIARYYQPRRDLESAVKSKRSQMVSDDLDDWVQQLVAQDNYLVTARDLTERVVLAAERPKIQLDVPEAGICRVLAYGAAGNSATDFWLIRSSGGGKEQITGQKYLYTWLQKLQFDAKQADNLDVHLDSNDETSQVVVRAFLATRERIPAEKRIETLLGDWKGQLAQSAGSGPTPKEIHASSGTMPAPKTKDDLTAVKATLKIPEAGDYFVVASTPQDSSVGLYLLDEQKPSDPKVLGSYVHEAPLAYVTIKAPTAMSISAVVVGNKPGTPVDLKVYKATGDK